MAVIQCSAVQLTARRGGQPPPDNLAAGAAVSAPPRKRLAPRLLGHPSADVERRPKVCSYVVQQFVTNTMLIQGSIVFCLYQTEVAMCCLSAVVAVAFHPSGLTSPLMNLNHFV